VTRLPPPTDFAVTPPPADGSRQPCPSCIDGYQYIDGDEAGEIRCRDCFGSGFAGDGQRETGEFGALGDA
jgi:hypothetical protein